MMTVKNPANIQFSNNENPSDINKNERCNSAHIDIL